MEDGEATLDRIQNNDSSSIAQLGALLFGDNYEVLYYKSTQ